MQSHGKSVDFRRHRIPKNIIMIDSVRCDHIFFRILYGNFTHRIENKVTLLINLVFGIILYTTLFRTIFDIYTISWAIEFLLFKQFS